MTRLELFRQNASEFNNLTDDAVNAWFSTALIFLDSYLTGIPQNKLDMAVALYAAHLCWLQKYPGQGGASRGPIKVEKEDKRQKEYNLLKNSDTYLGQSSYGQMFSDLTFIGSGKPRAAIMTRYGTN